MNKKERRMSHLLRSLWFDPERRAQTQHVPQSLRVVWGEHEAKVSQRSCRHPRNARVLSARVISLPYVSAKALKWARLLQNAISSHYRSKMSISTIHCQSFYILTHSKAKKSGGGGGGGGGGSSMYLKKNIE